jgi:hypothetical protein
MSGVCDSPSLDRMRFVLLFCVATTKMELELVDTYFGQLPKVSGAGDACRYFAERI